MIFWSEIVWSPCTMGHEYIIVLISIYEIILIKFLESNFPHHTYIHTHSHIHT